MNQSGEGVWDTTRCVNVLCVKCQSSLMLVSAQLQWDCDFPSPQDHLIFHGVLFLMIVPLTPPSLDVYGSIIMTAYRMFITSPCCPCKFPVNLTIHSNGSSLEDLGAENIWKIF